MRTALNDHLGNKITAASLQVCLEVLGTGRCETKQ